MIAKNRLQQAHYRPPDISTMAATAMAEQPMSIAMAAFGIGLGAGVGIGLLLSEMECFHPSESRSMMAQIADSVSRLVPDAIAQHLSH